MNYRIKVLILVCGIVLVSFQSVALDSLAPLQPNNINQLTLVATLPVADTLQIETSDDGRYIAHASATNGVVIFDRTIDNILKHVPYGDLRSISLSSDGSTIALAQSKTLILEQIETMSLEPLNYVNLTNVVVTKISFINQDQNLLVADQQGNFRIYTPTTWTEIRSWKAHAGAIINFVYREDNQTIISYGEDGYLKVWSISGELQQQVEPVNDISNFTVVGQSQLGVITESGEISLYELNSGEYLISRQTSYDFNQIVYSPQLARLITIGVDRYVRWWDVQNLALQQETLVTESGFLQAMVLSPSDTLLVGGIDNALYEVGTLGSVTQLWNTLSLPAYLEIAVSPDGRYVAVGAKDGTLRIWSVVEERWIFFEKIPYYLYSLVFSKDAGLLVGGTSGGRIITWRLEPQVEQVTTFNTFDIQSGIHPIQNTTYIAMTDATGNIGVWDLISGGQVALLIPASDDSTATGILYIASVDGFLITGHEHDEVRLWSTSTFEEIPAYRISQLDDIPRVREGFDDQHFFTWVYDIYRTPEKNKLTYWRIPVTPSPPIVEWSLPLSEDIRGFNVLKSSNIVIFLTKSGFRVTSFNTQGQPTDALYDVENIVRIYTSNQGETIVTETLGQLLIWQPR